MLPPVTCSTVSTLYCKVMRKANFKDAFLEQSFFLSHSSYQLIFYSNIQKKTSLFLDYFRPVVVPCGTKTKELFLIFPRKVLLNKRKSQLNWYLNSLWINLFWHLFHQKLKQSFKITHIFVQKIGFCSRFSWLWESWLTFFSVVYTIHRIL